MVKAPANFYYGVLWNKLYRRSIVEAHQLRCPEELSWCEDFLFNLEYIKYVRLVAAVPEPVCCYIKREDSLVMTQPTLRRTLEMKQKTFSYYKDLYQTLDLYERQKGPGLPLSDLRRHRRRQSCPSGAAPPPGAEGAAQARRRAKALITPRDETGAPVPPCRRTGAPVWSLIGDRPGQ